MSIETENTEHLTRREHEVMACLLKAMSDKQIAGELVLERETVRKHLDNIYRKLGVRNRTAAMVHYLAEYIIN
jgi:DNA-binding NarL/FixJ family response regulator